MPRYFLDLTFYDRPFSPDTDGALFDHDGDALAEARRALKELIAHAVLHDSQPVPRQIAVRRADGTGIAIVTADEMLPVQYRPASQ